MKAIKKIGIMTLAGILLATFGCGRTKQYTDPTHAVSYDASKIGASELNKENIVVKINAYSNHNTSSPNLLGNMCKGGLLRSNHSYYLALDFFCEEDANKDLAEFYLDKNRNIRVLSKENAEYGIFPVPEGVNSKYIPTKDPDNLGCANMSLEDLIWQPEVKIEHPGQQFWIKTSEKTKNGNYLVKYYGIEIVGLRVGDVSVEYPAKPGY